MKQRITFVRPEEHMGKNIRYKGLTIFIFRRGMVKPSYFVPDMNQHYYKSLYAAKRAIDSFTKKSIEGEVKKSLRRANKRRSK